MYICIQIIQNDCTLSCQDARNAYHSSHIYNFVNVGLAQSSKYETTMAVKSDSSRNYFFPKCTEIMNAKSFYLFIFNNRLKSMQFLLKKLINQ